MAVFIHLLPSPSTMIALLIWIFILLDFQISWPLVLNCSHTICQIMPYLYLFVLEDKPQRNEYLPHFFFFFLLRVTENDHLMMSMCKVFSCVVGKGCFLWAVCYLGKNPLAFALLHSVLQGQNCLLLRVFLDFLLLHSSSLKWKGHLFLGVSSKRFVGLHRTVQLQLLQCYWSRHRLGLLW